MASVSIKRLHNHWLANDIRKWSGRESSMWRPRSSFAIRMTSAQFIQCSNLLIRWPCSFDHLIYYHEFISLISFSKNRTLDFLKNQTMRIYFGYRLSLPLSLSLSLWWKWNFAIDFGWMGWTFKAVKRLLNCMDLVHVNNRVKISSWMTANVNKPVDRSLSVRLSGRIKLNSEAQWYWRAAKLPFIWGRSIK